MKYTESQISKIVIYDEEREYFNKVINQIKVMNISDLIDLIQKLERDDDRLELSSREKEIYLKALQIIKRENEKVIEVEEKKDIIFGDYNKAYKEEEEYFYRRRIEIEEEEERLQALRDEEEDRASYDYLLRLYNN